MRLTAQRAILLASVALVMSCELMGCATKAQVKSVAPIPPAPIAKPEVFGARPQLTTIPEIFALSQQQLNEFTHFFDSEENAAVPVNDRIHEYLQKYAKNYTYFNKTLTARQSLEQAQGNCLSLAILTTAFAKIVGVDTGYQLVESVPIYQKEGDIIISSRHVRSLLYDPIVSSEEDAPSGRAGVIIDYFPTVGSHVKRSVPETEFHAMYYRNNAAASIIQKDFDRAYWQLREALVLHPNDEHSINMMAVVHQRKGLTDHADRLYQHGLRYAAHKVDLLRNYLQFLRKERRHTEAKSIESRLAAMRVVNPFDLLSRGHAAFTKDDYSEARKYYRMALKTAPYLHQGHLGVARSEFKLGNLRASRIAMKLAKKNALDAKTRGLYERKMDALENY